MRIFRVDNPHTKPFRFWEWLICEVKRAYPEVLFHAEAFTRPKVMYNLASWVELSTDALDLPLDGHYQVHDLLGDSRYLWHGRRNYVELNPSVVPAHIFHLRHRVSAERDFEYYM